MEVPSIPAYLGLPVILVGSCQHKTASLLKILTLFSQTTEMKVRGGSPSGFSEVPQVGLVLITHGHNTFISTPYSGSYPFPTLTYPTWLFVLSKLPPK